MIVRLLHCVLRPCSALLVVAILTTACSSAALFEGERTFDPGDSGADDADGSADAPGPTHPALVEAPTGGSRVGSGELGWPLTLDNARTPNPDPTLIESAQAVRIGRLDNGLTYYLRENKSPGSSISLRLAVDAGSLQQDDPESGLAHFVEHMMFNGTERYPGNSLDRALQALGAEIGPDFNAFTSNDETVYSLGLPSNRWSDIELGFGVLREWAGAATMDEAEVLAERGVVREEVRLRDEGPSAVIDARFDLAYSGGTVYENTEPGGTGEKVLATTAADARRYYDRWYRPDNMAIIAVGDASLDDMEAEIIEQFADLENRGDGQERQAVTLSGVTEPLVDVMFVPDYGSSFISIDWIIPAWDVGTVGGERLSIVEDLIGMMMNNRLDEQVASGQAVLFDPFVGPFAWNRERSLLGVNIGSPDLQAGTQAVLSEFVRAGVAGFSPDELERAVTSWRSSVDQFEARASTLQDSYYADTYYLHFLSGADISAPENGVARLDALLDSLTVAELNAHFAWIMSTSAPLVILVSDDPAELPTIGELETAVAASVADGETAAGTRDNFSVLDIDTLVDPGPPVEIVDSRRLRSLDFPGIELSFENGARVVFAESGIEAGGIFLDATAEGGWSTLAAEDAALVPIAVDAVSRSGLGTIDAVSLDRFLSGTQASLTPFIDETEEGFSGESTTADLETLFQLVHLMVTAPAVDGPALAQAKEDGRDAIGNAERDPDAALTAATLRLRYGDDVWHRPVPTESELDALSATDALDLYSSRLGDVDDLVIAIVGDVDEARIIELSERYIGTLPAGEIDTWDLVSGPPPAGIVTDEIVLGTPQSAGAVAMLFTAPLELTNATLVELDLLDQIVNTRLFQTVREQLSATYGGWLAIAPTRAPVEGVESQVLIQGDPDRLDEIRDAINSELNDLIANGPTADEFERARSVLESDYGFISNGEILQQLFDAARTDGDPLTAAEQTDLLGRAQQSDIQALAAILFPANQRIEVIRVPDR